MENSGKDIQNIKSILEKEHGREFTWEEAKKAMWDLRMLAKITYEVVIEEIRRENLLKEHPKGYHLDVNGACLICQAHVSKERSWYDKHGLKCTTCQKAINSKIIPGSVAKNKQNWYSKSDLDLYFNIKASDLNRYIKQNFLKVRTIPGEGKKVHLQLFLIKDNKDVLPPKKLLKPRIGKVIHKGEEYYALEQWYVFINEKLFKRLTKYKIVECFKETFSEPVLTGRLLAKTINPLFAPKTES